MTATSRLKTDATYSVSVAAPSDQEEKNDFTRSKALHDHSHSDLGKSDRKGDRSLLFSITDPPPYLQIQSVPISKRVDPERNSYVLVIQPADVPAAGGQYSAEEVHEIAKATRGWDWSLDEDRRPKCLGRLIALLDSICKRSALAKEGGAS